MSLKTLWQYIWFPWVGLWFPSSASKLAVYIGPPILKHYGGPNLKIDKLKTRFEGGWRPNTIYVTSGRPLPIPLLFFAKRRGIRIVLNQDGVFYPAWYSGDCASKNDSLRRLHEAADFVIYQSQFCHESCERWVRPQAKPSMLLYNAVDTHRFSPVKPPPMSPLKLLACSYFNRSNGYVLAHLAGVLAKVVERLGPAELIVAGHVQAGLRIPTTEDLPEKIRERGGRISYHGPYTQDDAPSLYRSTHILVHLKYMDPCPTTVLEAMACAVPVVYSQSGGTPELVGEGGVGVAVPLDYEKASLPDPEKLAEAIQSVAASYAVRAQAARDRVTAHFNLEAWMQTHEKLFQQLLSGTTKGLSGIA